MSKLPTGGTRAHMKADGGKRAYPNKMGAPGSIKTWGDSDSKMEVYSVTDRSDFAPGTNRPVKLENTYRLDPDYNFSPATVRHAVAPMLENRLEGMTYEPENTREVARELTNDILERVKMIGFKRYKYVVLVHIGSLAEAPGLAIGSRCLWNSHTDSSATVEFKNSQLYACATVYGCYFD